MANETCPICLKEATELHTRRTEDHHWLDCPRCRLYQISGSFAATLGNKGEPLYDLSGVIRHANERNELIEIITNINADEIRGRAPTEIDEITKDLLEAIVRRAPSHAQPVVLNEETDYPLVYGANGDVLRYYLNHLENSGLITFDDLIGLFACTITPKGWRIVKAAKKAEEQPDGVPPLVSPARGLVPAIGDGNAGPEDGFQVVLLIHGIRTQADWGPMVRSKLEVPGMILVIPIKYGYFDAFRFWLPFWSRNRPVERVYDQIRVALQKHKRTHSDTKLSIIAHSFGTYVVGQILKRGFDLQIHRLLLCGSVLPMDFPWHQYQGRFDDDKVINDCGKADIWPVLARSASWGYGASGTHGFGAVLVKDRFHAGGHGQYFEPEFVEKYWEPLIRRGEYLGTEFEKTMPATPWWLSVLGILPLQWLLIVVLASAFALAGFAGWKAISQDRFGPSREGGSREQRDLQQADEPKKPPKPVLPDDIDIASASFVDYEGDSRAPRLDLKLTNMGSRPAFITKVNVNVKRTWRLRELPEGHGVVVPPDHNYVIKLKPGDHPFQIVKDISQGLGRDAFDRFSLQFEEDPWPASNTIYLADVELVANSNDTTYKTKDLLFLITQHRVLFPTGQSLSEVIAGAESFGKSVDKKAITEALAQNKRIIMEAEQTKAVKNPALLKLIESATASPIGQP